VKQGHYFIDGPQIGVPRLHWTKAQALKAMKAIAHDKWALLFQAGMFSTEPSGRVVEHGRVYSVAYQEQGKITPVAPLENYVHRKR